MTHDPLLHDSVLDAWMNDLDDDPNYSDYLDLIARVREDEVERACVVVANMATEINQLRWQIGVTRDDSYAAALRDAVEAVKAVWLRTRSQYEDRPYDAEVVAAIEALGGER